VHLLGEENIKMDFQEVGKGGMERIEMAQDRGMWRAVVTAGSIKCGEFLD